MWMVYGFLTLLMLLSVWGSGQHVPQKIGLLLLGSWSASNVAVALLGYDGANYVNPEMDAILAVAIAALGVRNRSYLALLIVACFVAQIGVHIVGFLTNDHGSYIYYLTLNLLFLLQLAAVGGVGGAFSLGRLAPGPWRFHHSSAGS